VASSFSDPTPTPSDESPADHLPCALCISRRRFGQHAALAAAMSLSPTQLLAVLHRSHRQNGDAAELTPGQTQEVDARLANIIRKYGSRLSDEQRQHLRRILSYNERMLASVRSFPLQNGDSPANVLKISLTARTLRSGSLHRSSAEEGNAASG
jgi:hypothetical protein